MSSSASSVIFCNECFKSLIEEIRFGQSFELGLNTLFRRSTQESMNKVVDGV